MGLGTLSSLSKCKNCMMASSMRGPECPSARTRRGRPGPRQVEAAGKLRSASTIRSPAPRLASSCSSEGDTMEGMEWSKVYLKHFELCYSNEHCIQYSSLQGLQFRKSKTKWILFRKSEIYPPSIEKRIYYNQKLQCHVKE